MSEVKPPLESETRFERRRADDIKTEVTYHNTGLKTDYNTGLLTDHKTRQAGMPPLHDPLDTRSSRVPKDRPHISSTNVESYIDDRISTHSLLGGASRHDEACIGPITAREQEVESCINSLLHYRA